MLRIHSSNEIQEKSDLGGNGNTIYAVNSASIYENERSVVIDNVHANDSAQSTVTVENIKLLY